MADDVQITDGGDAASAGVAVGTGIANMVMPGLGTLISAGLSIAGFGMKTSATVDNTKIARQYADSENALAGQKNVQQTGIIQDEQKIEAQRHQAMELDANRKQLENVRQAQQAQSTALAAAANQGAQFGSGLQGGLGQISGQFGTNQVGINNSLEIGRNVFDLNQDVSNKRIGLAGLQYQSDVVKNNYTADTSKASGKSSLGSSLMGAAGAAGKLFSGFNTKGI